MFNLNKTTNTNVALFKIKIKFLLNLLFKFIWNKIKTKFLITDFKATDRNQL